MSPLQSLLCSSMKNSEYIVLGYNSRFQCVHRCNCESLLIQVGDNNNRAVFMDSEVLEPSDANLGMLASRLKMCHSMFPLFERFVFSRLFKTPYSVVLDLLAYRRYNCSQARLVQ